MKLIQKDRDEIARRIAERRSEMSMSIAEVARLANIHPSQASRICAGEFKTLSSNVVQICKALGLATEAPRTADEVAWSKLEAAVRAAWDQTPSGADRLVNVMNAVAAFRGT